MPWWLAGGEETCPSCEQRYAYEVEVRCVDCDGPMCPVCAAWIEQECQPGQSEVQTVSRELAMRLVGWYRSTPTVWPTLVSPQRA